MVRTGHVTAATASRVESRDWIEGMILSVQYFMKSARSEVAAVPADLVASFGIRHVDHAQDRPGLPAELLRIV
jgi:hypothetical protein